MVLVDLALSITRSALATRSINPVDETTTMKQDGDGLVAKHNSPQLCFHLNMIFLDVRLCIGLGDRIHTGSSSNLIMASKCCSEHESFDQTVVYFLPANS